MQIDWDSFEFARTGDWTNADANIEFGCQVLRQNLDFIGQQTGLQGLDQLRAALAAYNAGAGNVLRIISSVGVAAVDSVTTGKNYSADVLNRAGWFQAHGYWRQVGTSGVAGQGQGIIV
jgi:soluble lytic murein transglycosylase-like protein